MMKAVSLRPQKKQNTPRPMYAELHTPTVSGASQTQQSSPRGPCPRLAPSVFRWTNSTRQGESPVPGHRLSVRFQAGIKTSQPILHLGCLPAFQRYTQVLADGLLGVVTELLLTAASFTHCFVVYRGISYFRSCLFEGP